MFDLDAIRKRAQAAKEQAADAMKEIQEKSETILEELEVPDSEVADEAKRAEEEAQLEANARRQVEILGQVFDADAMAQMAAQEEAMQQMIQEKAAEAAAGNVEALFGQLFGEEMGIAAAALEMLSMEDEEEEEEMEWNPALEQHLYTVLEEAMDRIEGLPEPEPVPYSRGRADWERFGILLSGILSRLNRHAMSGMDVEAHTPVMEQQIVSLVRRSWGIDGRGSLLDMIRYLTQEGYMLRYQIYGEAESPEELLDSGMEEEEQEAVCRAWRFVKRYQCQYGPGFLAGWDLGRAAMLTRWGCYLGWITEGEAVGMLWDLSQKAAEELHSWREFAQSYLFGGLMWKLLCGDSAAESYLGYLADAVTDLLTGKPEADAGQWSTCPWPAKRRIGFAGQSE